MQVQLLRTTLENTDFQNLVRQLDSELRERIGEEQQAYNQYNIVKPTDKVIVAYADAIPVGCGCFKEFNANTIEIKRMFVDGAHRGHKIGALILRELEQWGKELQYSHAVLETQPRLISAVTLYRREGYAVIPNYGQYEGMANSVCMKKQLL